MKKIATFYTTTLILLLSCGCAEKKIKQPEIYADKDKQLIESSSSNADVPDILVPVKLIEHDVIGAPTGCEMAFKTVQETSGQIIVEPISDYYNDYVSPKRMVLKDNINEGSWCDLLESYPQIDFYITNNLDKTLTIQSLDIIVEESKADPLPYLFIFQHEDLANGIIIWNEAWEDWGTISFDYKIIKRGESFDGHYDRNMKIPFFKDYMIVDFYNDLKQMGYKPDLVARLDSIHSNASYYWKEEKYKVCGHGCDYAHLEMPSLYSYLYHKKDRRVVVPMLSEEKTESRAQNSKASLTHTSQSYPLKDFFAPFEFSIDEESGNLIRAFGFARFYGKLSFEKSEFTKEIEGIVYLTPPGRGGAWVELNDQFDVLLKDKGMNYIVSKPYVTTIKPGKSERVRLTFKSDKSAIHNFQVDFKNNNGLNIKSKKVILHLLNGRHSSMHSEAFQQRTDL